MIPDNTDFGRAVTRFLGDGEYELMGRWQSETEGYGIVHIDGAGTHATLMRKHREEGEKKPVITEESAKDAKNEET